MKNEFETHGPVELGLTATPKCKDNVDNYVYFGKPVFIYSIKDDIKEFNLEWL